LTVVYFCYPTDYKQIYYTFKIYQSGFYWLTFHSDYSSHIWTKSQELVAKVFWCQQDRKNITYQHANHYTAWIACRCIAYVIPVWYRNATPVLFIINYIIPKLTITLTFWASSVPNRRRLCLAWRPRLSWTKKYWYQ